MEELNPTPDLSRCYHPSIVYDRRIPYGLPMPFYKMSHMVSLVDVLVLDVWVTVGRVLFGLAVLDRHDLLLDGGDARGLGDDRRHARRVPVHDRRARAREHV